VVLTGKQKAALLLMSLDVSTASELVKGFNPDLVQELALEAAYLDASGYRDSRHSLELAREFCNSLQRKPEFEPKSFLKEMLKNTLGDQKAAQIQMQIGELLQKRDPFIPIRSVDSKTLASVLEKDHPRAAAVVLSEMPTKKSSEILSLLQMNFQIVIVQRMATCESINSEAKGRIAQMVCKRLESVASTRQSSLAPSQPEQSLRKVAVILRNLGKEPRDGLLNAIKEKDDQASKRVAELMIVWEDIPRISDRSLQEALRGIEPQKLALALVKADEIISSKIKSNISERAVATVEEETSLMSAPKKEDIEAAREELVQVLREMNERGELTFLEE
jgi:flagellar motor switch protein FliG